MERTAVMKGEILTPRAAAFARIKSLVLDTLPSLDSKRAYGNALDDFFRWCEAQAVSEFTKAVVNSYRVSLEERSLSASTINQRLSAIRKLAMEAADNGLMPPNVATAISRVRGAKQVGIRTGQWLTREQAEDLISAPNVAENKGKRDRALLAVLIGCGLRRREAASLTVGHIQLRDARWVIVDLIGKGGRSHVVRLYQSVKRRKNHQKAVVAVARHLAEAAWWVLTKQEVYREPRSPRKKALSSTHG